MSDLQEYDPETWLFERDCGRTEVLLEQVLGQAHSYAMVLLHAELTDPDDDGR